MLSFANSIRYYSIKYNTCTSAKYLPVAINSFSTNIKNATTSKSNATKKYKKVIKSNNNNNNDHNNNNGDGVPYRRLAFSSKCYYENNINTIYNKNSNDEYIKSYNSLFKIDDNITISMTPVEMAEKCLAVNDTNSLIYVLSHKLPEGYCYDDKISRRIVRLLSSKGSVIFSSLLEMLRSKKLTLTPSDANRFITSKIKDKRMADAFSILTIAEDKGLPIHDYIYCTIAMELLDEKIGFDSNSFFYILSEMKNKNIVIPIVLKEKMILFCKMFPSLRWHHARKFITDFYKGYDQPVTRTESRLVREALDTMIVSCRVEEALQTWVDLSLFKNDKNDETNYEIFTSLNNIELASSLGRAAIILEEREILSFLFRSKALGLGSDDTNISAAESNESFDQYVEDLLLSERMTTSSASSPSATAVLGLGLAWLVSRNKLDVASRIWNDDSILRMDKRVEALQLVLDAFVYWKSDHDIPAVVTIEHLKKVSSFTSDIMRGSSLADSKLTKELIEGLISLYFLVSDKDGAVAVIMRSLEQSIEVSDASFIKVCQILNTIEEYDAVIELYKARMSSENKSAGSRSNSVVAAKLYSPLMIAMKSLGLIDDMKQLFDSIIKQGMHPTFPLYINIMEGLNSVGRSDEAVKFIINQPKPTDLSNTQVLSEEKVPSNYVAVLTSALHTVSLSTAASDDIIKILKKYCVGKLDPLQMQLIMMNMRSSSKSAEDVKKVLQYITMPKVLPSYLTANILMDMLLLSMACKDEYLLKLSITLMNDSEHSFTLPHTIKHKALGTIKIDTETLEFIMKFDNNNHKIISKALKITDISEFDTFL